MPLSYDAMESMMQRARKEKEVSIFKNGRSRAVRIPSNFQIEGDKVLISQDEGGTIHIREKAKKMSLIEVLDWLAAQGPLDEEFPVDPGDEGLLALDDIEL